MNFEQFYLLLVYLAETMKKRRTFFWLIVTYVVLDGHVSNAQDKWTCTITNPFGMSTITELEKKLLDLEEKIKRLEIRDIQKMPKDCMEIYRNGTRDNGVYNISPDGGPSFPVYCDLTNGGWTLIQRRVDGSVAFTRAWSEYVNGFGFLEASHWLGLEKIHRLTKDGSQVYFDLESLDGSRDYAHYSAFSVSDASTAYTMKVDKLGYAGSIPELLSFHDGMKFSTYDRDNDARSDSSCSISLGGKGGWWYQNCYRLGNFHAIYGRQDETGFSYYNHIRHSFLKTSVIKLKEI